jgi:hypothetical protein
LWTLFTDAGGRVQAQALVVLAIGCGAAFMALGIFAAGGPRARLTTTELVVTSIVTVAVVGLCVAKQQARPSLGAFVADTAVAALPVFVFRVFTAPSSTGRVFEALVRGLGAWAVWMLLAFAAVISGGGGARFALITSLGWSAAVFLVFTASSVKSDLRAAPHSDLLNLPQGRSAPRR